MKIDKLNFNLLCIFLIINNFLSCSELEDKLIYGSWVAKKISYSNVPNMEIYFSSRQITFGKNKTECDLPILRNEEFEDGLAKCAYFRKKGKDYVFFYDTKNKFFKDTFEIINIDKTHINLVNTYKSVELLDAITGLNTNEIK